MKAFPIAGAFALALAVAACGEAATTSQNQQPGGGADTKTENDQRVHSGQGNVTSVAGDQVSIAHGPIETLGWPAMTMTFRAESPQLVEGIAVGDSVAFQFRQSGGRSVLTSISKR